MTQKDVLPQRRLLRCASQFMGPKADLGQGFGLSPREDGASGGSHINVDAAYFLKNTIKSSRITAPITALMIAAIMPPPICTPTNGRSQLATTAPRIPTTMLPARPKP